jgi:hypothetical protein
MVARTLTCPDAFTLYTWPSSTNSTVAASLLPQYSTHGQRFINSLLAVMRSSAGAG